MFIYQNVEMRAVQLTALQHCTALRKIDYENTALYTALQFLKNTAHCTAKNFDTANFLN
jgi:hypothetical protein